MDREREIDSRQIDFRGVYTTYIREGQGDITILRKAQ